MTKRKLPVDLSSSDNFDDITSLHPSPNASLHAKIANASPMKKDKQASYFEENWQMEPGTSDSSVSYLISRRSWHPYVKREIRATS